MNPRFPLSTLGVAALLLALAGCSSGKTVTAYTVETSSAVYAAPLVQGAGSQVVGHPAPTIYAVPNPAASAPTTMAWPTGSSSTPYAYGYYPPNLVQTRDPVTGEASGGYK